MKRLVLLAALLAPSAALADAPSTRQLAHAISTFTGHPVRARDLRRVHCEDIEEEPTEFACRYEQRDTRGRWRRWSTYLAISGAGWQLIDEPGLEPAKR